MLVTDLFADAFFVADIALNFNTGFIREQVHGIPILTLLIATGIEVITCSKYNISGRCARVVTSSYCIVLD